MTNGENPAQNQPNTSLDDVVEEEKKYYGPSLPAAGAIGAGTTAYLAGPYALQGAVLGAGMELGILGYSFLVTPFAAPVYLIAGAAAVGYVGGLALKVGYNFVKGISNKIKSAFTRTPDQPAPQPVTTR